MKNASIRLRRSHGSNILALLAVILSAVYSVSAGQLTWDPLNNTGTTPANGSWDTNSASSNWYNGSTDVPWTQTSITGGLNGATFGGLDGNWSITNDIGQIAVTNLTINNSGYIFSGSPIFLVSADFLSVAAGKTVTFDCNLSGTGNGAQYWTLGNGATMNVAGNITTGGTGVQARFAGPASSAFYLGGVNTVAIAYVLAPVFVTNGSFTASSDIYIGYPQTLPAPNSTAYGTGILTIENGAAVTLIGNVLILGRNGGSGTLTLSNGTMNVGTTAAHPLAISYDGSAGSSATVNVEGGTLTVGSAGLTAATSAIDFFDTAETASATAVMNQSGGTVLAWGGILFGAPSGAAGTATLINSGGSLYIGKNGMSLGTVPPSLNITLSGGTVGALASWASSLPMTLGSNGNITFQSADMNGSPWNISLSGPLTGPGGLYVTGGGTLALSGANNYAGSTVVSNGTLAIITGSTPITNGLVTVDGSAGAPILSVRVSNRGQYWSTGALTYSSGAPTADFQYGSLTPSPTVGAMQVSGNVSFAATPAVTVEGTALAAGTYPLIQYTGSFLGTLPASAFLPAYASGYVTNLVASKTIALVVTSSTYSPAVTWAVGNGAWDTSTFNWKQFGSPTNYSDGDAVLFDDTASGSSPIIVTLNALVNPLAVTANNTAKNYILAGNGSIIGSGSLDLLGGGTVTLASANTYSGGTEISAGQLNINNGGTASASAIGTGTLTINAGAALDNTSGSNVTLQASIPEIWNGNFTYVGSAASFNTGAGPVTMNANVALTVGSNDLTVGSSIVDNGANLELIKTGNGALTLPTGNSFGGGLTLQSGLLNLGDPNAAGQGIFTINGGTIDNISGAALSLMPASYIWSSSFSFLGTTNLDLGFENISDTVGPLTVNVVSNTFSTEGNITSGNNVITKAGNGTWLIAGGYTSANQLQLVVSAGQVNLDKASDAIGLGNLGLTVQSGGLALDLNSDQIYHGSPVTYVPVALNGGVWDLNGQSETVDKFSIANGTLQNSASLLNGAASSTSTLAMDTTNNLILSGDNCQFNVAAVDGILDVNAIIAGSGTLVKNGAGLLNLMTNDTYTGNTLINSGTLALPGVSSIAGTAAIELAATNAALDLSNNTDTNGDATPVLTLQSGQTLSGFGVVTGLVQTVSGATLAPGSASTVGILTVTGVAGANTLNGATVMKLNKSSHTNDQLAVSGSLVYGGTLALTNLSGSLAVGDSFTLFNAVGGYSGAFASLTLPSLGAGLGWNTANLAVNGTLSVVATNTGTEPLTIVQQPSSQLNQPLGSNVELCITAESSASTNLQYQWLRNGVIILPTDTNFDGATNSCLAIPAFQATDSGAFSVEVGDGVSAVVSQPAEVTAETFTAPGEDTVEAAYALPQTNRFTVVSSNTNAVKEAGTPDIMAGDPGGSEIWFQWSAPSTNSSGIVTFSALGSGFDTTMGAYTGSSPSNLTQVSTVINDDDGAGYANSQISFYAVGGAKYLIAVDGFYGAQGNVVLSWTYYAGSEALPNTTNTPLVIVSSNNATVVLNDPWPGSNCDWLLDGQIVAADQTSLTISNLSTNSVGTYVASFTTPLNGFIAFSEPITVQINGQPNGSAATNSVIWTKYLDAINHPFDQPGTGGGLVRKLDTGGYSESQVCNTAGSNGVVGAGNPLPPGPYLGDCPSWYSFVPSVDGVLEVSTVGSSFPTIVAVYTGVANSLSTPVASRYYQGAWSSGANPSVYLIVTQNVTYSILIEGIQSSTAYRSSLGSSYPTSGTLKLGVLFAQESPLMSIAQTTTNVTISWPGTLTGNLYYSTNASGPWMIIASDKPNGWPTGPYLPWKTSGVDITYTFPTSGSQSAFYYVGGSPPNGGAVVP